MPIRRPAFAHARPAPRRAPGPPQPVTDKVTWTRVLGGPNGDPAAPRERYRITYEKESGERSERDIELQKIGHIDATPYLGVSEAGRFKTLRADRITAVTQLSEGHPPSLRPFPTYADTLPAFPIAAAVYPIPTTAVSQRVHRHWTVDLNAYTCTCPEKRLRAGAGYKPGQLGFVCDHMAKAILANLPRETEGWSPELLHFLRDPRRIAVDNLPLMHEETPRG